MDAIAAFRKAYPALMEETDLAALRRRMAVIYQVESEALRLVEDDPSALRKMRFIAHTGEFLTLLHRCTERWGVDGVFAVWEGLAPQYLTKNVERSETDG